jgi:hypothetical protein
MFKVGDWVRHRSNSDVVVVVEYVNNTENYFISYWSLRSNPDDFELWKPIAEDWCWYGYELVEVIDVNTHHIKICRQQCDCYEELPHNSLMPFIGELPDIVHRDKGKQ